MIVGLTGKAGTGKDTAGAALVAKLNFTRMAFADPIKEALNAMFGWPPANWDDREWKEHPLTGLDISPRRLAQTLGTEWGRNLNHSFWIVAAESRITQRLSTSTRYVFTDVRFNNEAEWIQSQGGLVVELRRDGINAVEGHASENGVHPSLIDFTLFNNESVAAIEEDAVNEISFKITEGILK